MHHLVRRALSVALAAGLLTAPAATALAQSPAPSQGKVTFTVGILSDVDSTNPFTGIVVEAYEAYALMYDYLVTSSPKDVSAMPSLAESYQEAPDKKSWSYKIRAGVKWSDGQPLTARDAAYTFNRIINGDFEQTNYGNYVTNIERAEATDDTTLVLHVKKPTPIMERLAVPILPEHIWKDIDGTEVKSFANEPENGQAIVGSGPFRLIERRKGQFLRFEANKEYWRGAPKIDELVFRVFLNADAEAQALTRGEIDFAYDLQSNVLESLKNKPGITTRGSAYSGFDEIAFNTGAALADGTPIGDGHPALKDKQVRLAISHAIDRDVLVNRVLGGNGSPADTFIPPVYPALHLDPANKQNFDPAKANQLLDAAGYPKGADGVREKDGKKLALRLFVRDSSEESQATGEFVKTWLKDIGIDVTIKVMSEDALTEVIGQGEYDMFEWGWVVEPDPDYQMSVFTCGKRSYKDGDSIFADLSDSFYCNPEYDKLYEEQAGETDPAKRAELAKRMQQMVYDDAAYAMTYYYDDLVAYRSDKWTGFVPQPDPDGSLLFQYGIHSYLSIEPVRATSPASAAAAAEESGGMSSALIGGIVGAVAVLAVGGVLVARRRRTADADERE
ncbi:ABC transporter substrate-binding protein [Acrocarpospora macrocephala]|uniref:Peptide ABC transporter substrate-binding protein n=1 Tax=Acrocarpospora macrocephala TaxID=150177 RepID=A0A5M3X6D3_9ACTN|nr:ABC transporter substrate-binding protein [Acrocarpospora macrocephala]GES16202.1 peptide ABC transporter substrate-binding protein [Acrocarpospora macrocephala]